MMRKPLTLPWDIYLQLLGRLIHMQGIAYGY
jgi:hypothetical protein